MLRYNGGRVNYTMRYFYIHQNHEYDLAGFTDIDHIIELYKLKKDSLYPKLLTIGHIVGGYLGIGFGTENFGQLYMFFSDGNLEKVANSFTEFIENLDEEYDDE